MLELLDGVERVRAGLARRRLVRVLAIIAETRELTAQITALVAGHADAVMGICGAGPIVAGGS